VWSWIFGPIQKSATHNDYESQRIFGLIQKSVVLIGDRVTVDFWINPKIHDTHNDYESQRIFGHVQKSAVLISCSCDRGFWTNPKIHNTNNDYESHRIFGLSKNPLCG
jgi:hypothetical protein